MGVRVARVSDPRKLRKLLRRHSDKILGIMIVISVETPQVWGSLKVHYRLEEVPWPVLLAESVVEGA